MSMLVFLAKNKLLPSAHSHPAMEVVIDDSHVEIDLTTVLDEDVGCGEGNVSVPGV